MPLIKFSIFLWLFLGLGLPTAGAQSVEAETLPVPFESIRIAAGAGATPWSRNLSAWNSGFGAGVSAAVPFYVGDLELGMVALPWTSKDQTVPDFMSVLIFAGWSASTSAENHVKASAGLRAGNYFMAFASQQVSGERNESEFALSPFIGLRRTFWSRIEGFVEVSATRVFTEPNLDLLSVRTGLSLTMDAPSWLREVLE